MNPDYPLDDFLDDFRAWWEVYLRLPPGMTIQQNSEALQSVLRPKYTDEKILTQRFWAIANVQGWLQNHQAELVEVGLVNKPTATHASGLRASVVRALHELVVLKDPPRPTVLDVARTVDRLESEYKKIHGKLPDEA